MGEVREGEGKSIILLDGSQSLPVRLCDKGNMEVVRMVRSSGLRQGQRDFGFLYERWIV
jgi:hypothetical protein